MRVAQQSTFIKASVEERQRESSHSGIKSTHIILVKDKSLSQRERVVFIGGRPLPVWEIFKI